MLEKRARWQILTMTIAMGGGLLVGLALGNLALGLTPGIISGVVVTLIIGIAGR